MNLARRKLLAMGGGILVPLWTPAILRAAPIEKIEMRGTARGERVWFTPHGIAVSPGTTIHFVNRDPGNSHTSTAYHPDSYGRKRRIPQAATPWDSDFLMPGESFKVTLTAPGVYDYYCIPHEMAAMVGRIVVGDPKHADWEGPSADAEDVSSEVLETLPAVEDILAQERIGQKDGT